MSVCPSIEYIIIIFLLYLTGFVSFLIAKISVFRKGIRVSFGAKQMSRFYQSFYISGYILMGIGLFLSIMVLVSKNVIK
jgi:hypothetical protein